MTKIKLLLIGNELLDGRTHDKNASYLIQFLQNYGLNLDSITTIKDHSERIIDYIHQHFQENTLIITSGGLGPTGDDLTKESLAQALNAKLEESEPAKEVTLKNYNQFNKEWDPKKVPYHIIPSGFQALYNPKGFAPGLLYQDENLQSQIVALPGVPKEFQSIIESIAAKLFKNQTLGETLTFRTVSIPESHIFKNRDPELWEDLSQYGDVASYPQLMGVDIVIRNVKDKNSVMERVKKSPIYDYIWSFEDKSLEQVIVETMIKKNVTLSLAESCTGGLAASRITDIAGSSNVFLGSIVSYANQVKVEQLGINEQTLKDYGAVSEQVAIEMARGALKRVKSNYAISFTGIAGPGGATDQKPVGTVCIAWGSLDNLHTKTYQFPGNREENKRYFSEKGLFNLLKFLKETL